MIIREHYIQQIRPFFDSDLIKIITGIRRSGKSVIMKQISEEIRKQTDNIIYLEFENYRIHSQISDVESLLDYVEKNRKKGKCYIFLDEIQILYNWAEAVKTLRLDDNSVFVTGSNSKLLSGEFAKELSGRFVSFRIRPFVYKEIVEYSKQLKKDANTVDYLLWGGFPKRFELDDESKDVYLNDLNKTIIINDIINRYSIRKRELFESIADFVFLSNSRIVSSTSILKYVKKKNQKCSVATIIKYIGYLEEAFAIDRISPYSTRTKSVLSYTSKIYSADVSLTSMRCLDNVYDFTHNLENIVYNELIYMGYSLMVFTEDNGTEIDFVAQKKNLKYFIQVAYTISNQETYDREMKPFNKLDNSCQKILITNDEIDYSTSTVRHIKLKDFLLMETL